MIIPDRDIFHVHTFRCRHAENIADEEYIRKAIQMSAQGIWFTDHAPFPGNPFGNRMKDHELEEYIAQLLQLKTKYSSQINIHIGLEIEYFPLYDNTGYYNALKNNPNIELLLLGQHMAETNKGEYTFSWNSSRRQKEEYMALGNAEIEGIKSGYFDVVAHPDRIFRNQNHWTPYMENISKEIIKNAKEKGVLLEQNKASQQAPNHYWKEFWKMVPSNIIVKGYDAHTLTEMN